MTVIGDLENRNGRKNPCRLDSYYLRRDYYYTGHQEVTRSDNYTETVSELGFDFW